MKRSKGSHRVSDVRGHNDETSIFGSRTMDFSFGWWTMSQECHLWPFPLSYLFEDFIFSGDS